MSTEQTPAGNDPKPAADDQNANNEQLATVPKSHADKLLAEKKKAQADAKALQDRLDALDREKAEKEGNLKGLADSWEQKAKQYEADAKAAKAKVVQDRVKSALEAEANKAGAVDLETLEKLVDFSQITVDEETLNVDRTEVAAVVSKLKASKPFLFKTAGVQPNNINTNPSSNGNAPTSTQLSGMKEDELKGMLAKFY